MELAWINPTDRFTNRHVLYVFLLVLVCHFDISAILFQVKRMCLSEPLIFGGKREIQKTVDIVLTSTKFNDLAPKALQENLQSPSKVPVKVCIDTFHILQRDLLTQYHFIERSDEEGIEKATVKDR